MIKIINLLPELLGTYGDQGNAATLAWRLAQRGISNQVIHASAHADIPVDGDFYLLGGGEDDAQIAAVELLRKNNVLQSALSNGAQIFAVCAGFQLLGQTFPASGGRNIEGLGLLPVVTESANSRSVGELLMDSTLGIGALTGFENHGGKTNLGSGITPLGRVITGHGNGSSGVDGAVVDNIFGTYLHGPVLARNPEFADLLLERAVGHVLPRVNDPLADEFAQLRRSKI
mgnify:CR=1 FL=1